MPEWPKGHAWKACVGEIPPRVRISPSPPGILFIELTRVPMNEEIHYCKEISEKPSSFFFQQGANRRGKKILILGESLVKNGWVESGKAFYTSEGKLVPTGKRLNEELSLIGLTLEECAFTEIAKCYIGKNRKQLSNCGLACAEHLVMQIRRSNPSIILSLGVITRDVLENIFGTDLPMGELREISNGAKTYRFLSLYHPSPANPFGHAKNIAILMSQRKFINKLLVA